MNLHHWFVRFDALLPSKQFFSRVRTIFFLPGLNQNQAADHWARLEISSYTVLNSKRSWFALIGACVFDLLIMVLLLDIQSI